MKITTKRIRKNKKKGRFIKPLEAYRTDLQQRINKSVREKQSQDGTFSAMRELLALNWFTRKDSQGVLVQTLKKYVMCMDLNTAPTNPFTPFCGSDFKLLDEEHKRRAKLLHDNEEVVDIVMHSIFQWFGTNVGREEIVSLAKVLDNNELLKDFFSHWKSRHVFCPNCNKDTGKVFKKVKKGTMFTCENCSVDFYKSGTKAMTHHGGMLYGK